MRRIEEKRLDLIYINQIITYKRSLLDADDNPTMHSSRKVTGQLLCMTGDRTDIPSGIIDHRGQYFRDNPITVAGQKRFATMDHQASPPSGRQHGKQETVPDAFSDARGSMDLPATAPRCVSPTCASESRPKALPSSTSTHKTRARTSSAHRARVERARPCRRSYVRCREGQSVIDQRLKRAV